MADKHQGMIPCGSDLQRAGLAEPRAQCPTMHQSSTDRSNKFSVIPTEQQFVAYKNNHVGIPSPSGDNLLEKSLDPDSIG
ncbi:hypothetical protein COP1_022623 [Malus domestica]